jgi:hypothetical protein
MIVQNRDYREIKTSFCFLDETGFLYNGKDKYFALGIVKCLKPEREIMFCRGKKLGQLFLIANDQM